MGALFEELASSDTSMGAISLRRRLEPTRQVDVYEVKLDDEFLMSSLFTIAEVELARLGLAAIEGSDLEVAVGGLGLGYTARAALDDDRVASLVVIEVLGQVISWHESGLLPDVGGLCGDPRTRLVRGDFFAMADGPTGFDPDVPARRFDAVLIDIDHTPRHHLAAEHAGFYTTDGLRRMRRFLRDGGVFGLWSDGPPDDHFLDVLGTVFDDVVAHEVSFPNFYTGGESSNTVYLAR